MFVAAVGVTVGDCSAFEFSRRMWVVNSQRYTDPREKEMHRFSRERFPPVIGDTTLDLSRRTSSPCQSRSRNYTNRITSRRSHRERPNARVRSTKVKSMKNQPIQVIRGDCGTDRRGLFRIRVLPKKVGGRKPSLRTTIPVPAVQRRRRCISSIARPMVITGDTILELSRRTSSSCETRTRRSTLSSTPMARLCAAFKLYHDRKSYF